jgi:hypothetical protein
VLPCFSLGFDKVTMYQFTINVRDISKFSAWMSIIGLVNGILGLPWLCKKSWKCNNLLVWMLPEKVNMVLLPNYWGVSTLKVISFWSHCQVSW